ncbi:hypothetical protein EDB19DRAFT_1632471 [Suillus lakei]|nr:hypothetical protein EDB19DRAFT_1632471 [Suillus lakei]
MARRGFPHVYTVNSNRTSSGGTQSPPFEYTDSHRPMGCSSIDASVSEPMLDEKQRKSAYRLARLLYICYVLTL